MSTVIQSRERAAAAGNAEIEAAKAEHAQAAELLAALEERVRAGDPDVKPNELRDARELVEYAALRIEAARRRAEQLATDARHALYAEAGAEARALDLSDDPLIEAAFAQALGAVHHLYEVTDRRQASLLALIGRAEGLVDEASKHQERGLLRSAGIHMTGLYANERDIMIVHEDDRRHRVSNVQPYRVAFAVLGRLLGDIEQAAKARGERFYAPWAGDESAPLTNSLTMAAREFPGLTTVAPATVEQAPAGAETAGDGQG
jgi:hypothetical protein